MARVLLVRHAPTPETGTKLTGRLPGVGLGSRGVAIAEAAADRLSGAAPTAIATSPVQRCAETAAIVGRPHAMQPEVESGVEEIDFGRWQGRTLNSLSKLKAWETVQQTPSRFRFPDGETFAEAQVRSVDAIERLAAANRKGTVIVCSHADVIKLVLAHYLGTPLDLFQRLDVRPASVSELGLHPGRAPQVVAMNVGGSR